MSKAREEGRGGRDMACTLVFRLLMLRVLLETSVDHNS